MSNQTQNGISDERLAETLDVNRAQLDKLKDEPSSALKDAFERTYSLLCELTALRKEEQRWEERWVHTQDWYARHYEELHKWARLILPEHFRSQFFNCIANGSFEHSGGTGFMLDSAQQQILHDQSNRAEDAEAELEALRASHKRLVEALESVQPYMEAAEKAGLVGDEGCHWPVENVRAVLAEARKLEGK